MVTGQNDVMVAYGGCQEIGSLSRIIESDDLLRATEVSLGLIPDQFSLFNEAAGEVA